MELSEGVYEEEMYEDDFDGEYTEEYPEDYDDGAAEDIDVTDTEE